MRTCSIERVFLVAVLGVCGCSRSTERGDISVRLEPDVIVWLSDAKTENIVSGQGPLVRIPAVVHGSADSVIRDLAVANKSCGCFDVQLGSNDLGAGGTVECSILMAAKPLFAQKLEFTVSGVRDDGEGVSAAGKFKVSFIPEWDVRIPTMTFHLTDDVLSSPQIILDHYQKSEAPMAPPVIEISGKPNWLSISHVKPIGHRFVMGDVFVSEYEVAFVADRSKLSGEMPLGGTALLSCSGDVKCDLSIQYGIVNHGPCFVPDFISFEDTPAGRSTSVTVRIDGLRPEENIELECSDQHFTAVELQQSGENRTGSEAYQVKVSFSPNEAGIHKGTVFLERPKERRRVAVLRVRGRGISPD